MGNNNYHRQIIDNMINELWKADLGELSADTILNFEGRSFIPSSHPAEQWLIDGPGVFGAIRLIAYYDGLGLDETDVDLCDPSSVVDRFVYHIGFELLLQCQTYLDYHNDVLTEETRQALVCELAELAELREELY